MRRRKRSGDEQARSNRRVDYAEYGVVMHRVEGLEKKGVEVDNKEVTGE